MMRTFDTDKMMKTGGGVRMPKAFSVYFFVVVVLIQTGHISGQSLNPTISTSGGDVFVEGREITLLCQLNTAVTGSISGDSPLSWSSSASSLPPGSYNVKSADAVAGGVTSYKNRLVFTASADLTEVIFTCTAAIGSLTGSKTYEVQPVILIPDRPVLTGPTRVKAGEQNRWTCFISGASITGPNVYFRDGSGASLSNTVTKQTSISVDSYSNLIYDVTTNLDTSLPAISPQFTIRCVTVHEIGNLYSDQKDVSLVVTVEFLPQLSKSGSNNALTTENVRTTISCIITASSPSANSVTWTKDGVNLVINPLLYEGGTTDSPSLIIKSAKESDSGDYICFATNSEGTGKFANATNLTVRFKAKFGYATGTTFNGGAGATFTLPCDVRAVPDLTTIRWKRVLNSVTSTIRIDQDPRLSGGDPPTKNYGLTFSPLQPSDGDGEYYCEVDNDVGSGTSPRLTIVVNDRPTVTASTTSVTVRENEQFVLSCVVVPINSLTALRWEKDGVTLDTNSNLVKYFGGNTFNPSLTIRSATDSDVGKYVCVATNVYGSTSGPSIDVTLLFKPRVSVSTSPISRSGGETIFLTCAVTAEPQVTLIYWSKNGVTIDPSLDTSKYSGGTTDNPPLIIFNAEVTDSGDYFCVARNDIGTTFSSGVFVSVTNIPKVVVTPTTAVVGEGSVSHTFACAVTSSPAAIAVYWTFNGVRLTVPDTNGKYTGATLSNPSLIIRSIQKSDDGSYVCLAVNSIGTGQSVTADLSVTYLPIVNVNTDPIGKQVGTFVTIGCSATANPAVSGISWVKNGIVLNTGDPLKYQGGTLANPSLTISKLETGDTGSYSCRASNSRGSSDSAPVSLKVSSKPVIERPAPSVEVVEGQAAIMLCIVTPLDILNSIEWTKDGITLNTTDTAKYGGGTTTTPSLTVYKADDNDVGNYRCVATNEYGQTTGEPSALVLKYKPRLTVPSTPIVSVAGNNVFLSCVAYASPRQTLVYWTKEGSTARLSSASNSAKYGGSTVEVPSLTILNADFFDTGSYYCNVVNTIGSTTSNRVDVSIEARPTVTVVSTAVTATEGDKNLQFACNFQANPSPADVYWTKDTFRLRTSNEPDKYSGGTRDTPTLTIKTVAASDAGRYNCIVVNTKGAGTSPNVQLTIRYKPVVKVPTTRLSVSAGSPAQLTCSVSAFPAITQLYWTKDSDPTQLTSATNSVKYVGGTTSAPSLTIIFTTIADSGRYFCVATNPVDTTISDAFQLSVEATPTVTVADTDVTATDGDTDRILGCNFQANPAPQDFYWTKDGNRLNTAGQPDKYSGGTSNVPSLTIKTISPSDRGQYVCVVVNDKGVGSSPTIQLTVRYKPILSVPTTAITQNTGARVVLSCSVDANPAISELYWLKDSGIRVSSTTDATKYGGGTSAIPSLTILSATLVDNGKYSCFATNDVGSTESADVDMIIEGKPEIYGVSTNPTADENTPELVLQCNFRANPAPLDLYWTKDGSRLDTAGQPNKYSGGTVDVPSLTIKTVSASDKGLYICQVVNSKGTGSSPLIDLSVRYNPIVTVSTTPISVPAGTPITLICNIDANPSATSIGWTVFGATLDTSNANKYRGGTLATPNLSILVSTLIDSGDYACVVGNIMGATTSSSVSVSFTSLPSVTATVPSNSIREGSVNVVLSCDFRSVPSANSLYWTKDGSQIDISQQNKYAGGTLTTPTLTIKTIAYNDGASYKCNVVNDIGTGISTGGVLDVTYKPRLTVPTSTVTSSPATTVILACNVDANPTPTRVYWTKDGNTIDSASNTNKYRGGTKDNPTLSILSSAFSDNGDYACVAINNNGQTKSPDVTVSITNVPVVTNSPASTTVAAGTDTLELTCTHLSNPSASQLFWTRDGTELSSTTQPAKYDGGKLSSSNLVIKNVAKTDRGTYVCNVKNSLGTGVSSGVTVDVTFKPDLVVPTTPIEVSRGSPVTLTCSVDSNPKATNLYWTKNGVQINPSAVQGQYTGGTLAEPNLTILSPEFSDTGSYACVVVNTIGATSSPEVPVNITSVASVTASLTVSTVSEDAKNIVLTCNYQANPDATRLYWSKDGAEISSTSQTDKYSGGTLAIPNLTIKVVKRTDKGTYICNVVNNEGTGSSLGLAMDVTYKPAVTVSTIPIVAETGTSVTLTCVAESNPAANNLYWVKAGAGSINSSVSGKYRGGTLAVPTLTITNTAISDSGTFSCVVVNSEGTTTSPAVSVSIVSLPTVTASSAVSTVKEGATNIIFSCAYTSNPSPVNVYWTKNGTEIDVAGKPDKYGGGTVAVPSLTVKTVDRTDIGDYICNVVNSRGTGKSNAITLNVTFKPTITTVNGTIRAAKNGQVTLTCDVSANPHLDIFFWSKDGVQLNLAVPAGKYSGGTIAETDLTISNLDEVSDPASYRCTATNTRGTTISDPVVLGVTFDPVVNIGGDVTGREGEPNMVISCDVQMFPAATSVTWLKDSVILQLVSSKYQGGTTSVPSLTVLNPVASDAGLYQCSANNGETTKTSGTATVTVQYVPKISNQSPKEAQVGGSVTLPCVFQAVPSPTSIEWKKLVPGSSLRTTVSGSRFTGGTLLVPSLTISDITIADTTTYICLVTNSRGTSEGSVDFKTRYQPQSLVVNANPTSLNAGSRFVLTCSADAYPAPSGFAWYRGNSNTPVSTSSTYTKAVSQPADNDNFRCLVTNDEGSTSKSLALDIRFTPISSVQGRQTVTGQLGISVTLTCEINANPAPTSYAWYKGAAILINEVSQQLVLPLTSDSDFGDYSCTATNVIGTMSPPQQFSVTSTGGPTVGASTSDDGLSTTTIVLIAIIVIILLIILILIIIFCCLQGTCAKCCGKKDKTKVSPAQPKPLPPMYSLNGGHFGPVVAPESNGKLKLNEDDDLFSPRVGGAGPIISVPETRGPRAHHLPPLSLETTSETPREERRRSRRKKRRRRQEDETHLTGDKGDEEIVVTNGPSHSRDNFYENI